MDVDGMAMQVTRIAAANVLTWLSPNISIAAPEEMDIYPGGKGPYQYKDVLTAYGSLS